MTLLSIIARELRRASKRRLTYYFRCLASAIAFVIVLGLMFQTFSGALKAASLGANVLICLGALGYLYAIFEGALITCDCLSREKRDGTLGLLFLTDLRGHDVVLGKFAARSWHAFGAILAAAPAPALTFLMGGVNIKDVCLLVMALLAALFFSASVGMFFSALLRSGFWAMTTSLVTVLLTVGALLLLAWPGGADVPVVRAPLVVLALPGILLVTALAGADPGVAALATNLGWPNTFGWALGFTILFSSWLLAAASWVLPRSWQDTESPENRPPIIARLRERLGLARFDRPHQTQTLRGSLLSVDPSLWMAERRQGGGLGLWGIVQLVCLGIVSLAGRFFAPEVAVTLLTVAAIALHYGLKFRVAAHACRALAEAQRSGGLELLLTTGLDVEEIVRGCLLAMKRRFLGPTLLVLATDAALVVCAIPLAHAPWLLLLGMVVASLAFVQIMDLHALAWMGLWQGLRFGSMTAALRRLLLHALIGQWSTYALIAAVVGFITGREDLLGLIIPLLVGGCAGNISAFCYVYSRLMDEFRITAAKVGPSSTPATIPWWPFRRRTAAHP